MFCSSIFRSERILRDFDSWKFFWYDYIETTVLIDLTVVLP